MSKCRGCQAEIIWAVTAQGKSMPLDREPQPEGNVTLTGRYRRTAKGGQAPECHVLGQATLGIDVGIRYMPHHATCPNVVEFRR